MNRFLRETRELFYWSIFLPSKLQQRVNEWVPLPVKTSRAQESDTASDTPLFLMLWHPRLLSQYTLLFSIFSLPLLFIAALKGHTLIYFLLPFLLGISFFLANFSAFLGFISPIFASLYLVYQKQKLDVNSIILNLRFSKSLSAFDFQILAALIILFIIVTIIFYIKSHNFDVSFFLLFGFVCIIGYILVEPTFNYVLHKYKIDFFSIIVNQTNPVLNYQIFTNVIIPNLIKSLLGIFFTCLCYIFGIHSLKINEYGKIKLSTSKITKIAMYLESLSILIISLYLLIRMNNPIIYYFTGIDNECFISESNCYTFFGKIFYFPIILFLFLGAIISFYCWNLIKKKNFGINIYHSYGGSAEYNAVPYTVTVLSAIMAMPIYILCVLFCNMFFHVTEGLAPLNIILSLVILFGILLSVEIKIFTTNNILIINNTFLAIIVLILFLTSLFILRDSPNILLISAFLIGYYRWLDYPIMAFISGGLFEIFQLKGLYPNPLRFLRLLPPYSSEFLYIPLPNHDRILATAFRYNADAALPILQQMRVSSLPGLQSTAKQALPKIVADQLARVGTIDELLLTVTSDHPLLPLLIPIFYLSETELEDSKLDTPSPFVKNEIYQVLKHLKNVVDEINKALAFGTGALRSRLLEDTLNQLDKKQVQLLEQGFDTRAMKRWQPVFERWRHVIELEIKEQRATSPDELLNPFQFGNPLRRTSENLFKGRKEFAEKIVRLVLDRNRPTLVLHGPRRCGKSSFLLNLPGLLLSNLIPVYVDMQEKAATENEAAFWYNLVRVMHRDSKSQGVELPKPIRQNFLDSPYTTLQDWLDEALPLLEEKERQILLNLDEFEKIGIAINQGRLSMNLFDQLRHLIQHCDQLAFLFSGVQTLDELGPNWSSFFISVVPIEMLYLNPNEAEDLLLNPDPEFALRYDTGIISEILRLTRCHPYLLQLIGSALVTQANVQHTKLITHELLEAAVQDSFTIAEPYFTNVWTEYTGTNPSEVEAGQEFLIALVKGLQPGVAIDVTTQAARRRLLRYHVIEHTEIGDRFEIPLFELWVRERAF